MEHRNQTKRPSCFRLTPFFAKLFLLIAVLALLSGCENKHTCDKESSFLKITGMEKNGDINETIRVDYVNGQKTQLYAGDELLFDVILTGFNSPITFDLKETEKFYIFMQDSCEWVVIDNHVNYLREEYIVKPVPVLPELVTGGTMVIPSEFIKEPTSVRIVSKGYLLDEDGNKTKPLLGFFDVVILPER